MIYFYHILQIGFAVLAAIMLVIALLAAVLGVFYFFADRGTTELYNQWRGKK
jgi:hypothetical protein